MKFFKVTIKAGDETDTVYVYGDTKVYAMETFECAFGDEIPANLLTWTEIQESDLPPDEVWL